MSAGYISKELYLYERNKPYNSIYPKVSFLYVCIEIAPEAKTEHIRVFSNYKVKFLSH